jgi:hypothetical protein
VTVKSFIAATLQRATKNPLERVRSLNIFSTGTAKITLAPTMQRPDIIQLKMGMYSFLDSA